MGTPKLWVLVYRKPWRGLPGSAGGYGQKIAWWSEGYNARADPKDISITGRRLGGPSRPMDSGANGAWHDDDFIMSGVDFPTAGCWEVTGRFHGGQVRFVVRVE